MSIPVFHKGQLVWAKVKGFSWWPAEVNASNKKRDGSIEKTVLVLFLFENKLGKVSCKKIVEYEAGYEKFSKAKNKTLLKAVEIAQEIFQKSKNIKEPKQTDTEKHEKKNWSIQENKTEPPESKFMQEEKAPENQNKSQIKIGGRKNQIIPNSGKRSLRLNEDTTAQQNNSPRLSKVEKKQQIKRQQKLKSNFNRLQVLQKKPTRPLSKIDEIEVLSEQIIYSGKKKRKIEKGDEKNRDSSFEGSVNENSSPVNDEFDETQISLRGKVKKNINFLKEQNATESPSQKLVSDEKISIENSVTISRAHPKKKMNDNSKILAQLEAMSMLISKNLEEKGKKNVLDEADQDKLSKILSEFQSQISNQSSETNFSQNSFKIIKQVVTLLLKNQNLLNIKEVISDQLIRIQNSFLDNHSISWDPKNSENIVEISANINPPPSQKTLNEQQNKENATSQESHIFFRKSVCQKLAKLLEEIYCLGKDPAQELTLLLEGRINSYFSETLNDYKKAIKALYKLMKVKMLQVEELKSLIDLKSDEFKSWLKLKVQKAINSKQAVNPDGIEIEIEIEQKPLNSVISLNQ